MFMKDLFPRVMFDADKGGSGGVTGTDDLDNKDGQDGGQDNKDGQDTGNQDNQGTALTKEEVEKMIQSATDKVRTEYSKKLKDKDKELEDAKKSKMTEQEKAEYELNKLKESLSQKERDLLTKELTLETIDLLKENELPLEAKDFLMGQDSESTKKNVEAFKSMFNSAVEAIVNERFKSSGKNHESGDGSQVTYTQDMLKTMSAQEINDNWEKIQKDLSK